MRTLSMPLPTASIIVGATLAFAGAASAIDKKAHAGSHKQLWVLTNATGSKFGVGFTGSLRLEVTDKFKDPVDFFCVIHKGLMPGVLKLAP
ncbi:hypothetical protein [Bradyrhizobium sp. 18]|uniref:hypothetical protein n=1 Tax=Bradyrhizobium sp. 18 TaxID=2782657 RepID=UPI001FF9265F|nr:hypothetical protein [Bradyrhizobium sp. 18]MCK1507061.1 hypothetical protein [Bradyrhizobium sp. 18]